MNVSIITVCKNAEQHLERAIRSVVVQTYPNIQYILVDGKSTDTTLEMINKYRNKIDVMVSEPDTGIYNAMNKALKFVTGDIVYFLNSDDHICDIDVIADVANTFNRSANAEIVYGNVMVMLNGVNTELKFDCFNGKFLYKNTICHQALFIKKKIFDLIGGYDEKYQIHADVDWLMKAYFRHKVNLHYFDRTICHYSSDGFSSNPIYAEKYKYDRQEISGKYFLEARIKLGIKRSLKKIGLYN